VRFFCADIYDARSDILLGRYRMKKLGKHAVMSIYFGINKASKS
jgi:hypothetical protein